MFAALNQVEARHGDNRKIMDDFEKDKLNQTKKETVTQAKLK